MKKILFLISLFIILAFCFPLSALGTSGTMELKVQITHFQVPERASMVLAPGHPYTEMSLGQAQLVVVNGTSIMASEPLSSTTQGTGTIIITNDSNIITGVGTAWAGASSPFFSPGDFIFANNEIHMITGVTSNTVLTTNEPWTSPTKSGVSYSKASSADSLVQQGSIADFSFPYNSANGHYYVYLEIGTVLDDALSPPTSSNGCSANCTLIPAGSGGYFIGQTASAYYAQSGGEQVSLRLYNPPSWWQAPPYAGNAVDTDYPATCPTSVCNICPGGMNGCHQYDGNIEVTNHVVLHDGGHWWRSPALFTIN